MESVSNQIPKEKNNMIPVLCMVSDKHLWALRPFIVQFQKYWGSYNQQPVIVAGYTAPDYALPPNFRFISLGKFEDYPANKYSDSLIKALQALNSSHVILMLEDFWLTRPVHYELVTQLSTLCKAPLFSDVIRLDLTSDRMYARPMQEIGSFGYVDLFVTPAPSQYRVSFQASIYNTALLLQLLIPGESPWDIEMQGTSRLDSMNVRVLGTRQPPLRYFIACQRGQLNWQEEKTWQAPASLLTPEDKNIIRALL